MPYKKFLLKQIKANILGKCGVEILLGTISLLICINPAVQEVKAQSASLSVDLSCQKFIGTVSDLDRSKYFNMHHSYTSWELNDNGYDTHIYEELGVGLGRQFAGPGSADPLSNGTYASAAEGTSRGKAKLDGWDDNPTFYDRRTDEMIITDHNEKIYVTNCNFDRAAAFAVNYFKEAFKGCIPKYYEVMNEPFVHAGDFQGDIQTVKTQMSQLWKTMAVAVHNDIPGMKIGGYASAWPEMEKNDFDHWNDNQKLFMDIAGADMDFISTHLYDGQNVTGDPQNRSGSNAEAILDLIEAYSYQKWGTVKPHMISEYGKTVRSWTKDEDGNKDPKPYSEARDGEILKSVSAFCMQFIDKPDRMLKTIPFIEAKANWFYSSQNPNQYPYPWVTLRKKSDGSYAWTHLKKFYELWKSVEGKRVQASADDPDIITHAFVDGKKAYIAMHNLEFGNKTVNLNFLNNSGATITDVTLRRLYRNTNGVPQLDNISQELPDNLVLKAEETVVMICNLENPITFENTLEESTYYSDNVLHAITANTNISYSFTGVQTGLGFASLRMGIGRDHTKSKKPAVKVNGTTVNVPSDWAGYDQANRNQFFGVIEIPVPMNIIEASNTVTLTFPDNGGKVASLILNVEKLEQGTGVADHGVSAQKNFNVYYMGNNIILHADQTGAMIMRLFSVSGRELARWTKDVSAGKTYLSSVSNTSLPASGVYCLILEFNGKRVAQKNMVMLNRK